MRSEFGIIQEQVKDGFTVVYVDTTKAKYKGLPWRSLGDFGKRKFENVLVLTNAKERLKINYV